MRELITNHIGCALLGLFFVSMHTFGAASSSGGEVPERKHAQFIMLIDDTEGPNSDSSQAVTKSFMSTVYRSNVPFIVSKSIVYNYLFRLRRNDRIKDNYIVPLDWNKWQIYLIGGASFMLFVPKGYDFSDPRSGLRIPDLKMVKPLSVDPLSENFWQFFIYWQTVAFTPSLLREIFKTKKESSDSDSLPIWDIVIHGHGTVGGLIGGMSAKTMQDLLLFFNNNLSMGALYIESCSAGGKNRSVLQFDQAIGNKTLLNLHYTVFVGSVSDSVTWIDNNTSLKWQRFFEMAQEEKPLGALIEMLGSIQLKGDHDPFASTNIPQVWVPGGYGFQTYQVDKRIKVLSKVLVAAHEDEKRPIIIPETTEVVLIYPQHINVPVIIKSPRVKFISMIPSDEGRPYHYFRFIQLSKKESLAQFVHDIREANADVIIDELTVEGYPTFRKSYTSKGLSQITKRAGSNQRALSDIFRGLSTPGIEPTAWTSELRAAEFDGDFSIQDLIDLDMIPEIEPNGALDLANKKIGSLVGLDHIKGIENVRKLYLGHNKVTHIIPEVFKGLVSLKKLFFYPNRIRPEDESVFEAEIKAFLPEVQIIW